MKTNIFHLAVSLLIAVTFLGCREESLLTFSGEGKMTLSTSVMSDIKVVSRTLENSQNNDLASKTLVWISNSDNELIYRYEGIIDQANELTLQSGIYYAEGWVGDSIPAFGSWEEGKGKRYHTRKQFEIISGETTPVKLVCGVRNTLASLNIDDNTSHILKDISFEVALNDGITDGSHSVVFQGENLSGKGYFMINSRTKGFIWTLSGTDIDGKTFTRSGEYKDPDIEGEPNLARATEYVFNINYNSSQGDIQIGGVYLDIDVVPEPVEGITEEILIPLAPEIVGINGYSVSRPLIAEPGTVGTKSIHIIGSCALKSIICKGDIFDNTGFSNFDLITIANDEQLNNDFASKGINVGAWHSELATVVDDTKITNVRLDLDETFTNSLPKGEYTVTLTATDENKKTSVATLTFNITEAPGQLVEIIDNNAVSYTSANLSAEVSKPGTKMGFEVKADASGRAFEDWTYVPGTLNGKTLTAKAEGLNNGTKYLYRLVVDEYTSPEMTFETIAYPQLPNAGFEEWFKGVADYYGKDGIYIPCAVADLNARYWDSGNHGSMKMSINITTPDETVKHSGKYSIRLRSDYPSFMGIGRFAAGNVFTGQYLKTDGTDGELGWGRPFESTVRPKALQGYVKYSPAKVNRVESAGKKFISEGDMDQGIIYIALLTDTKEKYSSTSEWPVVVKTKSTKLFDKNADNVVAYGECVFNSATPGNDMIKFTIPIEDVHGTLEFKNIMVIASASRYGDYFTGGEGSTMWLDDLELVYE